MPTAHQGGASGAARAALSLTASLLATTTFLLDWRAGSHYPARAVFYLTPGAGKRGLAGAVPRAGGEAGHRVPGGRGRQTGRARPGGEPRLHHNIYPGLLLLPSRQLVAAGSQLHVLPHLHHGEPAGPGPGTAGRPGSLLPHANLEPASRADHHYPCHQQSGRKRPVRLSTHQQIAQAFAKRAELQAAGRLNLSFHSEHGDPLGLGGHSVQSSGVCVRVCVCVCEYLCVMF